MHLTDLVSDLLGLDTPKVYMNLKQLQVDEDGMSDDVPEEFAAEAKVEPAYEIRSSKNTYFINQ